MILADYGIRRAINELDLIDGYRDLDAQLQPASFDLCHEGGTMILAPRSFTLTFTTEKLNVPDFLVATVHGKSSWAREGLQVHSAGFIDPGFRGQITLECTNLSDSTLVIEHAVPICQVTFAFVAGLDGHRTHAQRSYAGKYQGQSGVVASRRLRLAQDYR